MTEFRDKQAVAERCNNNPKEFVTLLESALTNEQVSVIEIALFPEPTEATRKKALEEAHLTLVRAGFPADDPAVTALNAEIGAIQVEPA